ELAHAVGESKCDRVFVEFAARGEHPHAVEPEDHQGQAQQQQLRRVVELHNVGSGDVNSQDHHSGIRAGRAEAAQLVEIGDHVAASVLGNGVGSAQIFEFGKTLDDGQGEKQ